VQQAAFSAAEAHFRQALAHYMAAEDEFHIAKVQCNIAVLPSEQQKLGDVPAALLEARSVFQRLEARYDYGLAENDVGYTYLHLGRFAEAETAFQAALQTFRQIGSLNKYALALSNLAELYVTSADWSRAVPTLTEARELALVCERPLLVAAVDVDRGRMLLAQGDEAGASAAWQAALAVQRAKGAWSAARYTEQLLDSLATGAQSLDHQA
jgi:tetratricopeptide (TPR) repeat protein